MPHTTKHSLGRRRVWCSAAICAIALSGCVADGPQPSPKPSLGPPPGNAQADVLLLNLGPPSDADGDTVPDTLIASVHVFDERYQLPVRVQGRMTFTLFPNGREEPLCTWSYAERDLQRQVIKAQVGPVYRFRLSVPVGIGSVRERFVTVRCVFESPTGAMTQAWHRDLPWLSVGR